MSLTAAEVCAIIKASGDAGVVRLRFENLRLSFDKPTDNTRPPSPNPWELVPGPHVPSLTPETPAAPEHEDIAKDTLEADELDVRQEQFEELLITNPLKAEEMISNGELISDGSIEEDE